MVKVIFLDDGGVMNDNTRREPQWRELVSDFFAPRYGGSKEIWKSANRYAFLRLMENYNSTIKNTPLIDSNAFWMETMSQWITDMFKIAEIDPPPIDQRFPVSREAEEWITPRVDSAYPGIVETIFNLKDQGYTLCTASGEVSYSLHGYLSGMGVLQCFNKLYGPDLINTLKGSKVFYEKILTDMKISPEDGLVVDDSSEHLKYAKELGIKTVHVLNSQKCEKLSCDYHIDNSNELGDLMREIL
ncbi:MAG: HAD family hydrolase [Candidatus Hodarchaeales archaeon]|jgi:HAD superfamily hydrolase (TIGR01509 family)